ncbi:MAG TPA: hypothetical protein VFR07_00185 [Mycobacteriales bacterium]|jgi:hypothetical protein|nr:hypothetical protein [Mycobacteriales bacterium]
MTPDELREQLDRELAGLVPGPHLLPEVLAGARPEPARRGRGGPPPWFVAAAAVLAVALAVPVLRGTVLDRDQPPVRVAAGTLTATDTPRAAPPSVATVLPPPTVAPTTPPPVRRSTPPASPRPTATPTGTPASPASTAAGCAAVAAATPGTVLPLDLDRDRKVDAVYALGGRLVARLSDGDTFTAALPTLGTDLAVLPVHTGGASRVLLMVLGTTSLHDGTRGRLGRLYEGRGCALTPVLNAQGAPYTFEVGSTDADGIRAGVACEEGTLFGTTGVRLPDGPGWAVTRTPVTISGGRAVNGTPRTPPAETDDVRAEDLREASCLDALPLRLN